MYASNDQLLAGLSAPMVGNSFCKTNQLEHSIRTKMRGKSHLIGGAIEHRPIHALRLLKADLVAHRNVVRSGPSVKINKRKGAIFVPKVQKQSETTSTRS